MYKWKNIESTSLLALTVAVLSIPLYLFIHVQNKSQNVSKIKANFVGNEKCIECHHQEHSEWLKSHHAKAMNLATDSFVLGNFNNQSIKYNNITHRLYKRNNKFFAYTDGADGKLMEFEIKYVFGFYPLQQYLVEFPGARLQTLPLTWDSKNKKWYHIAAVNYPNEIIKYTNWLHWTNQSQNWNSMCADCHSTGLIKGYDMASDSYKTTFSEINVSCEACHGPASLHIKWAKNPYASDFDNNNYGLVVKTSNIDNEAYVNLCMRCHARRATISDYNHDFNIYNHSIPELPNGENYFIDGQILSEDYVFASFTQSKMYMKDVKCNDCHNVHTNKLIFDDNRLCTQCHRADDYDTYNHHFHKSKGERGKAVVAKDGVQFDVGEGTRCINCHAPARFYMGVDYRNDHSFRIPRPDLSQKLNTPNACNNCHADKSKKWAVNYIKKWYGISRHSQYGEVFHEAKNSSKEAFTKLVEIYRDEVYPPIIRATAIKLLSEHYSDKSKNILFDALQNTHNIIRYNALHNLILDDNDALNKVFELLNDNTKAIRIECADKLMTLNNNHIPTEYQEAFKRAKKEYFEFLKYNSDYPGGKYNLANYYYNLNQLEKAEKFYLKALNQDEELHFVKINLALLYNQLGYYKRAESLFKDYLDNVPNDGNSMFTYALFLSERKRYKESMNFLLKASKLAPENARIFYNIAIIYDFENNYIEAKKYLRKAVSIDTTNNDYKNYLKQLEKKYKK